MERGEWREKRHRHGEEREETQIRRETGRRQRHRDMRERETETWKERLRHREIDRYEERQ